jgi:crotonobetaine/carnitine-CoA ligase
MIVDLLSNWAERTPDAAFVVTDDGSYSYAEIRSHTLRMAARLDEAGIGRGDHVALVAGNSAGFLVSWFAINALGGVAVTLNNQLKAADTDYLLTQSDSRLIVADRPWIAAHIGQLCPEARDLPLICMEADATFFAGLASYRERDAVSCAPDEVCTILYTSGTTGLPKGVMCTHAAYVACGRHSARILGLTPSDRTFVFMPLFHTNPQTYAVMSALYTGSSLALRQKFSATSFFDDARRLGATGCTFVGTVLAILAARYSEPQKNHAMRYCIGGGTTEELARTVHERFGLFVHELYGMTETGGWVSGSPAHEHRVGANGKVRDDMEVQIVDADDRKVPTGTRGEIVVRPKDPYVILVGYYNKPEQMISACRNLWFHTGDIGSFDEDGFLYFHGRAKELIRRGGEMIAPIVIEQRLRTMGGVLDCAAVGVPDDIMGEEIKLVIVASEPFAARKVREHLAETLPHMFLPRYVEFVEHIPRTESEKVLRRELVYVDERVTDLLKERPVADG